MSNAIAGKLIQIIKNYPVLYDPNNGDYRNKEVVETLWQKLGVELNEDYMELRKRWRNLRDTYVKMWRLVKNSENDEVFRSAALRKYYKWVWTREMEFFRQYLISNKLGEVNLSLDGVDDTIAKEQAAKTKPKPNVLVCRPVREAASKPKKFREDLTPSPPIVSSTRKVGKATAFSSNARTALSTRAMSSTKANNKQSTKTTSISNQTELDATDHLFLAHARSIKQFSARRQAITKLKIAEVIMEQEILDQEEKDTTTVLSTKSIDKRKRKEINSQNDEIPLQFETVCGYDTDKEDEVPYYIVSKCKKESNEIDPVDDNDIEEKFL